MALYRPPPIQRLRGGILVPGDKSITHRALLCAALARGISCIRRPLRAGDTERTRRALRALGATVGPWGEEGVIVDGRGLHGLKEPRRPLECGNSGTSMRLLAGLCAGHPFLSLLSGDRSLSRRPMGRVVTPLRQMGARVDGRAGGTLPPLAVRGGSLRGIRHRPEVPSAQVKSALLLAGLSHPIEVAVEEPLPTRDHTEILLKAMGADIRCENGVVILRGGEVLRPIDWEVPRDFSAAAFFLVLALLAPDAEIVLPDVGINPRRTGLLDILRRMGATITIEERREVGGEQVATLRAATSALRATEVAGEEVVRAIDEIPIVAIAAARAEGRTVVRGAGELRAKESDRLRALARGLRQVGIEAEELPDGLVIGGSDRPLAGRVSAAGDHRIAMAFAILGALPGTRIEVSGTAAVWTSFPGFFPLLERCAREGA